MGGRSGQWAACLSRGGQWVACLSRLGQWVAGVVNGWHVLAGVVNGLHLLPWVVNGWHVSAGVVNGQHVLAGVVNGLHVSQQLTFLYSPHTRIRSSRPDAWSVQEVIQAGRSVRLPSPGKASAPLCMWVDTSSYAGACVVRPSEKAL